MIEVLVLITCIDGVRDSMVSVCGVVRNNFIVVVDILAVDTVDTVTIVTADL